jgi:hypothetical protein
MVAQNWSLLLARYTGIEKGNSNSTLDEWEAMLSGPFIGPSLPTYYIGMTGPKQDLSSTLWSMCALTQHAHLEPI